MSRSRSRSSFAVVVLALVSATTSALVSATPAAAGGGLAVFVGYADNSRALVASFPNPWSGSPKVIFDGCQPACTFDSGAVRVENDTASPAVVNRVDVHIDTCLYTWTGPFTLAPGQSLIATQLISSIGGCTGPVPDSFDSSDIGPGGAVYSGCTNDGIRPTVDVTAGGVTTSYLDSGQVINTGGIDAAHCAPGTSESTQWVLIGSPPCPGPSRVSLAPATQSHFVTTTANVSATYTNSCGQGLSSALVNFNAISGPNAGVSGSATTDLGGHATFSYSSLKSGVDTLRASVTNATGFTIDSNTVTVTWTITFAPGGGSFVIGDQDAAVGSSVTFWGAQWARQNGLSAGPAPRSLKGFAESPTTPSCGVDWSADPGNSSPPPSGPLPPLMGVIVTSAAAQSGSTISGSTVNIVIVTTAPGYGPNPGHAGEGTVVAEVC